MGWLGKLQIWKTRCTHTPRAAPAGKPLTCAPPILLQGVLQGEEPKCPHEEPCRTGEEGRSPAAEGKGGQRGCCCHPAPSGRECRREGLSSTWNLGSRVSPECLVDIAQQNNSDSEINGFFLYKGPRSSVKGCRIQFSLPLVFGKSSSCFPGAVSMLVHSAWGSCWEQF